MALDMYKRALCALPLNYTRLYNIQTAAAAGRPTTHTRRRVTILREEEEEENLFSCLPKPRRLIPSVLYTAKCVLLSLPFLSLFLVSWCIEFLGLLLLSRGNAPFAHTPTYHTIYTTRHYRQHRRRRPHSPSHLSPFFFSRPNSTFLLINFVLLLLLHRSSTCVKRMGREGGISFCLVRRAETSFMFSRWIRNPSRHPISCPDNTK